MNFYATFSIPFIVGVVTMFVVLIVKYGSWIFGLSAADRMRIVKGIPSRQTHWRSGKWCANRCCTAASSRSIPCWAICT